MDCSDNEAGADKLGEVKKQFFNRLFFLKGLGLESMNPVLAEMVSEVEALGNEPNISDMFPVQLAKLSVAELKGLAGQASAASSSTTGTSSRPSPPSSTRKRRLGWRPCGWASTVSAASSETAPRCST